MNGFMTPEMVNIIKDTQSAYMAAQLEIAYAEALRQKMSVAGTDLGANAPIDKSGITQPSQQNQPSVAPNVK